jgi:formyl-CoA transferase
MMDPHFRQREAVIEVSSEEYGTLGMQGVVPKLSETPGTVRWMGPNLGQHNDEVLRGMLGLGDEKIGELKKNGVI